MALMRKKGHPGGAIKKRKPLKKKRSRKSLLDQALKAAEEAWKQAIYRRDKGICQVHGPSCALPKQADHCRTRTHSWTFLDPRNGTLVCNGLNQAKANGWHGAAEKIAAVVIDREGRETFDYLFEKRAQPKKWTLEELEQITCQLNGMFN